MSEPILRDDLYEEIDEIRRRLRIVEGVMTNICQVTTDPTGHQAGDIWYRTDTNKLSISIDGSTVERSSAFT